VEALELKASKTKENLKVMKSNMEEEQKLPFKPEIGNKINRKREEQKQSVFSFLYQDSKGKRMRQDRSQNEIEFERQREELTFQPNLQSSPKREQKKLKPMFEVKKSGQPRQRKQPKYVVAISLGGSKQQLLLYEDSDVSQVILDFSKKHGKNL